MNMRPDAARSDQHRMARPTALYAHGLFFTPLSLQELLADAGCSISDGDVLNTAVRRHQVGDT